MKKLITLPILLAVVFLAGCAQGNDEWKDIKSQVLPQLVPSLNKVLVNLVTDDLSKESDIAYVVDKEESYDFIMQNDLETWEIDHETLKNTAMKNLEKLAKNTKIEVSSASSSKEDRYAIIETDDSYGAVRILVPWIRKKIAKEVGNPAFAATPTRDFLIFWNPKFSLSEKFAMQVQEEFKQGGKYAISPTILRVSPTVIEYSVSK